PQSQSPYQLDKAQTLKAARALLKHISTTATSPTKPNLLSDPSDPTDTATPIYLILTTKSYLTAVPVLKPIPIRLPHALHPPTTTICLIVKDPQRFYKDLVATSSLSRTITKVISISKLKKKFKSFESQRQLRDSHDIFLADSRIATLLPSALGSTFYRKSAKIPATVELGGGHDTPEGLKRVVEKALQSTHVHLTPATHTTIRVALSSFTPEAVVENISTLVEEMLEKKKKIPGGFRSIKSIHIKSPTSASLPVYMAGEVYGDEDVLKPEEEKERLLAVAKKAAERKERKETKEKNRK
ncbi:ribosomal protein L1, partial [Wilcoxina mikolae CBS 423.85]